jgi:hypothetical protein
MSTPFKMKGWSGYQKSSPLEKGLFEKVVGKKFKDTKLGKTKIGQDITEAGKQIKEDFGKDGKVYKEIGEDVKKLKSKLGLKEKKGKESEEDESNINIDTPDAKDINIDATDLVKVNDEIPDVEGFVSGSGSDPWEYKKIDGGYQTRKGPNGDIITITDPNSEAYKKIGEKIFDVDPVDPVKTEKIDVKEINTDKLKPDEVGTLDNPHDYYPGADGVDGQYYTNKRTGQTMKFIQGIGNKSFSYEYMN